MASAHGHTDIVRALLRAHGEAADVSTPGYVSCFANKRSTKTPCDDGKETDCYLPSLEINTVPVIDGIHSIVRRSSRKPLGDDGGVNQGGQGECERQRPCK